MRVVHGDRGDLFKRERADAQVQNQLCYAFVPEERERTVGVETKVERVPGVVDAVEPAHCVVHARIVRLDGDLRNSTTR